MRKNCVYFGGIIEETTKRCCGGRIKKKMIILCLKKLAKLNGRHCKNCVYFEAKPEETI